MRTPEHAFWTCLLPVKVLVPLLAGAEDTRSFSFYVQQAWPQQSVTKRQLQDINRMFGTNFDDWSDVPDLSLGPQLSWRVAPRDRLSVQVDHGSGSISRSDRQAEITPSRTTT